MTAPPPFPSASDREWEQRAQRLVFDALPSVRKSAESWRTGIVALTSFVGVGVSVVGLVGDTNGANASLRFLSSICWVISFVLLAGSCWLAMEAAYGRPAEIGTSGRILREWSTTQAKRSASMLVWSQRGALGGLCLLLLGTGLIVFNPSAPAGQAIKVETSGGEVYCGVGSTDSGGKIVLTGEDGSVRSFSLGGLTKLSFVDSC